MRLRSAIADLRRQAWNPYSLSWLWIPGSLAALAPRNDGLKVSFIFSTIPLIRLRQAQNLLGNKAENELRADRGDPRDQGFAQVSLDMIFLGVTEASMSHNRLLAGLKAGFSGKIFRGIRRRAAWQALVVLPARRQNPQPCGFELHPVPRQRMLDRLGLADRTIEHDAALGIVRGARERHPGAPLRFGRQQHARR